MSNIYIGRNAGLYLTTGDNNIIIGDNSGTKLTDECNVIIIGDNIASLKDEDFEAGLVLGKEEKVIIGKTLFGKPLNLKNIILEKLSEIAKELQEDEM